MRTIGRNNKIISSMVDTSPTSAYEIPKADTRIPTTSSTFPPYLLITYQFSTGFKTLSYSDAIKIVSTYF